MQMESGPQSLTGHNTQLHCDVKSHVRAILNRRDANKGELCAQRHAAQKVPTECVNKKLTRNSQLCADCLHGAILGAGLCPPAGQALGGSAPCARPQGSCPSGFLAIPLDVSYTQSSPACPQASPPLFTQVLLGRPLHACTSHAKLTTPKMQRSSPKCQTPMWLPHPEAASLTSEPPNAVPLCLSHTRYFPLGAKVVIILPSLPPPPDCLLTPLRMPCSANTGPGAQKPTPEVWWIQKQMNF